MLQCSISLDAPSIWKGWSVSRFVTIFIAWAILSVGAAAQSADTGYQATIGDWQTHVVPTPEGGSICFVRAIHPAIAGGDVLWIIDPKRADTYPSGYLVATLGLIDPTLTTTATLDGSAEVLLEIGFDGSAYSTADGSAALREAMADGFSMRITSGSAPIEISLIGFRSAVASIRETCNAD